jgi:hypothetical protein
VTARSEGAWGNNLRLDVDYDTANPDSLFNLTITELVDQGGSLVRGRVEKHRNLSMSSFSPNYVEGVIGAASELVDAKRIAPPANFVDDNAVSTSGVIAPADLLLLGDDRRRLALTLDGVGPREFDFLQAGDPLPPDVATLAGLIQLAAQAAFGGPVITVAANGPGDRLVASSQTPTARASGRASASATPPCATRPASSSWAWATAAWRPTGPP